jgi:hypothetical protein
MIKAFLGGAFATLGLVTMVIGTFVVFVSFFLAVATGLIYLSGYFFTLATGIEAFTLLQSFYIACCVWIARMAFTCLFGVNNRKGG